MEPSQNKIFRGDNPAHRVPQLSLLVDMDRPVHVLQETQAISLMMHPDTDLAPLKTLFKDIVDLFNGKFPGYQACSTGYHNLKHTTDITLAMARLIHGACVAGSKFSGRNMLLGIMAALFHDVGYIKEANDFIGTGAKLTAVHIPRSIRFMTHYLTDRGYSQQDIQFIQNAIECTDLNKALGSIRFNGEQGELTGKMLAAADLLAQTADRNYLEKLPFLFAEFKEAGLTDYQTELDLFKESLRFNEAMKQRLEMDLDGVNRFLPNHFEARWNIRKDMYQDSIDKSMQYLSSILSQDSKNCSIYLRRKNGI